MLESGEGAGRDRRDAGLKQTSDTGEIDAKIDEILAANADKVEQYKAGKEALFGFFVGQTMKAMAGKANPQWSTSGCGRNWTDLSVIPDPGPAFPLQQKEGKPGFRRGDGR